MDNELLAAAIEKLVFEKNIPLKEVPKKLNISKNQFLRIYKKIRDEKIDPINLHILKEASRYPTKIKKWSKEEDELLLKTFHILSRSELTSLFIDRSFGAICTRAYKNRCKKRGTQSFGRIDYNVLQEILYKYSAK